MIEIIDLFLRLIAATVSGAFIGFTRERIQRPAGLRTHALISVGAAFITELSIFTFFNGVTGDPGRVAAQIVSGIGFLGAGTILKKGFSVKGLTTAATLWVTAAIGMGFGAGEYFSSALATSIVLLIVVGFKRVDRLVGKGNKQTITIEMYKGHAMEKLTKYLEKLGITPLHIEIETDEDSITFELVIKDEDYKAIKKNIVEFASIEGIISIDLGD
ncbi:MgtC/SapB family protein [Kosmotoga pacifica]|uniref:Magnesium transporter MgtC n=1 Tax=Kosmotoga pacifica TaxID=1330330 RepID=A0A0G2Z717_9BACT|nr:MgtC/SapB family protein [Kosmotoga pacifica]AKI97357.1 magnesium transporter MgtC [Kosmotoga pacifica]